MSYLVDSDFEKYYSLALDVSDLAEKMPSYSQRFRAKPRLDKWIAPKAHFYASDNYTGKEESIPDITTWALGNIVLSPRAFSALKDILNSSGEFLPLLIGDETYYMFNTLYVISEEYVDSTNTIEVVNSGVHMGQDSVKFIDSELEGQCIFKSYTNKLTFSFVTEEFKTAYEANSFTGLKFQEVS
ncbi:hypothetical protein ACJJIQ_21105 [Microbulbifer sp. ANSA003]|uniref:hypothetical protein n=1 Tax=Microbulbifer sp. ANSA003 TaxID=3243360 RepID=UPI0040422D06